MCVCVGGGGGGGGSYNDVMFNSCIGEFLQEHNHVLETRLQPIIREIAESKKQRGTGRYIIIHALLTSHAFLHVYLAIHTCS